MKPFYLPVLLFISLLSSPLMAVEEKLEQRVERALVQAFGPQIRISEVSKVANKQLLEVVLANGSIIHMTPDMNFVLNGDEIYSLEARNPKNLTQARANPRRQKQLNSLKAGDAIVFPAKGKKKTHIYVFTDVDCGYCQKLHDEMSEINKLGIEVRYLAYPRAGISNSQTGSYTDSYKKLNYAWCAKDRKKAMTDVKQLQQKLSRASMPLRRGNPSDSQKAAYSKLNQQMDDMINNQANCNAPIEKQLILSQKLGLRGTPAIISENGELYPGYVPAKQLAERLGLK